MKINKILAMAGVLSLVVASSAFAAPGDPVSVGTPEVVIKPSKGVTIVYTGGAASGGHNMTYALTSTHMSGTKIFGSTSGDTKIFSNDTVASTVAAPAVGETGAFSGWTAM